ncbi:MAG: DoxX family protein, partial [Proteobacteria bacterium]|nr:DoxX family protein [Pseudomonadota bacterium]
MTDGNHSGFVGNKAHWPLAVLRVYTGIFFLIYGFGKLQRDGGFADGMSGFLNAQENTFGFYRGFIESVVLPNAGLFSYLVACGETVLGIALILGLATRYTAFAGAFLVAYLLLGLVVLHVLARKSPFRHIMLASLYLGILLFGWGALL